MAKIRVGNYSDTYEFENRYKVPVDIKVTESTIQDAKKNYNALVARVIASLNKQENRPSNMRYYDYLMSKPEQRLSELKQLKEKGRKIIGVFCVQVPDELIYAAGCIPVRLECGFHDAISVGEEACPANSCPAIKSTFGFPFLKINPLFDLCDAVVMPTTCDGKVKMAEILSNIKPVWVMELPKNREHLEARDLWISQVQIFMKKLEKLTGKSVPRAAVEASIKMCRERTNVTRQLLELRKAERPVISGRDTLLVIQTAFSDDIHRWTQHTKDLVKELSVMSSQGKSISKEDAVRIMMTGSPVIWPTWKVLTAIEEAGGIIVIDDSCAGSQWFYNTVEVPDYAMKSMIYAIADKYLLPTICPVFIHSDDRVDRILELYSQYKAEGVVYHVLRLCQLIDFEHSKVSAILRPKNIPVLKVETEFGEEDIEQIKTRVEAFLEMIRVRRK